MAAERGDEPSPGAGGRARDVIGHIVWLADSRRRGVLVDALCRALAAVLVSQGGVPDR